MLLTKNIPKPFLRWVGGKVKLAKQLICYIPSGLNNYYEPFLGGGALFFQVKERFKQCYLSDINLELVTSYNAIKKNPLAVSQLLAAYTANHSKEYYFKVRDDINYGSNPQIVSARFLYLNRYAFSGIYRIRKKDGVLNIPFSADNSPKANIDERLKLCSHYLSDVPICANDFSFIEPAKDDFVYFDPPYHQAGEEFYTRLPFDEKEQIRLRDFVKELDNNGTKIMISNSNTDFIRNLYQNFNIHNINTKYAMSVQKTIVTELLITNY